MSVSINALSGIPEVKPGDNLGELIISAMCESRLSFEDGDVLVIAQKIVSKSEDCFVDTRTVLPSEQAKEIASRVNKDPRKVQVILDESVSVVRVNKHKHKDEGVIITRHRLGFVCANAAVDESNVADANHLLLLPKEPDISAKKIREQLETLTSKRIGIVISDTFGRPWRLGLVNVAIGVAGIPALIDLVGEQDAFGRALTVTKPALADEVAAASGLLMSKNAMTPVIHFRGVDWPQTDSAITDLLRPTEEDLFQ